ncbi:hypothetical protein AC578_8438 [Pseudocercospora eumusae]|uniref:DUF125-domain-containing protein n=1 Tax=Pseudocercospora eumusae TaxID=321146 RepID=A0A139HS07_9PEZI|nr:hypothetical protein AC578_8438 [Pseudocercospora eumusae]
MKLPTLSTSRFAKQPTAAKDPEKTSSHSEKHAANGVFVRDSIIGFADGLTVPFALTAGLSSLGSSKIVVLGGLAELFAGSISMGLGAYLAAVTEKKHYEVEEEKDGADDGLGENEEKSLNVPLQRKRRFMRSLISGYKLGCTLDQTFLTLVLVTFRYGIARTSALPVVDSLKKDEDMWVKFMMDFELKLEKPSTKMAWIEGLVMGISYFFGGLLPMIPYFATRRVSEALIASIGITSIILLAFGYTKSRVTGCSQRDSGLGALQTLFIGGAAAGVSYGIVKGINSSKAFD